MKEINYFQIGAWQLHAPYFRIRKSHFWINFPAGSNKIHGEYVYLYLNKLRAKKVNPRSKWRTRKCYVFYVAYIFWKNTNKIYKIMNMQRIPPFFWSFNVLSQLIFFSLITCAKQRRVGIPATNGPKKPTRLIFKSLPYLKFKFFSSRVKILRKRRLHLNIGPWKWVNVCQDAWGNK